MPVFLPDLYYFKFGDTLMNPEKNTVAAEVTSVTTEKKAYSAPKVTEHGTVEQITGSMFVYSISGQRRAD
jgi:hypothetical protein